jgi:hypothetical protein
MLNGKKSRQMTARGKTRRLGRREEWFSSPAAPPHTRHLSRLFHTKNSSSPTRHYVSNGIACKLLKTNDRATAQPSLPLGLVDTRFRLKIEQYPTYLTVRISQRACNSKRSEGTHPRYPGAIIKTPLGVAASHRIVTSQSGLRGWRHSGDILAEIIRFGPGLRRR